MSTLLIVAHEFPLPATSAPRRDAASRLPLFRRKFGSLHLACFSAAGERADAAASMPGMAVTWLPRGKPGRDEYGHAAAAQAVVELVRSLAPDLIWLEYSRLAVLLPAIRRSFRGQIVCRSLNFELFHALGKVWISREKWNPLRWPGQLGWIGHVARSEWLMLKHADRVAVISRKDVPLYAWQRRKVHYLPYLPPEPLPLHRPGPREGPLHLFYMGGDLRPGTVNAPGLRWIETRVLPSLERGEMDAVVHVVGRHLPERIVKRASERFRPVGFVEDLEGFLLGMDAALLPLGHGFGLKVKAYESLARGFPCLGFPWAFREFDVHEKENVLLFRNLRGLRQAVEYLQDNDHRQRLAQGARDLGEAILAESRERVERFIDLL